MPRLTSHQQGRINLSDLKLQIAKRLGPDRTQIYFGCLNRFLARALTKTEFNKVCLLVLARENIPLHNKLIRSILRNAYEAKTPPPVSEKNVLNQTGDFVKKSLNGNDPLSRLQTIKPLPSLIQCNGDILPPSPQKKRSRKSPLGFNGAGDVCAQQSLLPSVEMSVKENGILGPCGRKRPLQHYQSGLAEQPVRVPRIDKSLLSNQIPLHRKGLVAAISIKNKEKLKESNDLKSTRRPIRAPLGVPVSRPSVGGIRRSLSSASSSTFVTSNYDNGELCHTEDLRKLMEKIAEAQGIGVTLDCANLLNNALNTYLKRLIKSSVELASARTMHEQTDHSIFKQQLSNGAGNHIHAQNDAEHLNVNNGHRNPYMISMQDFWVAMELNPRQLGETWPFLLEKICIRSYDE